MSILLFVSELSCSAGEAPKIHTTIECGSESRSTDKYVVYECTSPE